MKKIGFILSALTLLVSNSAYSGWQSESGTSCKPISSSYIYGMNQWTGIRNNNTSNRYYTCSIPKDDQPNDNSGVYVTLHHASSGSSTCWVNRKNYGSQTSIWGSSRSTSGSGVRIIVAPHSSAGHSAYANYTLLCSIPRNASIMSLLWAK